MAGVQTGKVRVLTDPNSVYVVDLDASTVQKLHADGESQSVHDVYWSVPRPFVNISGGLGARLMASGLDHSNNWLLTGLIKKVERLD